MRIIDSLEPTEAKKAVSFINSYGDDALEMFKEGKSFDEVKKIVESGRYTIGTDELVVRDSIFLDADGNKVDNTTLDASITNSTEVMMTTVSGNDYAIGYASLGSLNDTVKAVKVGGVEATADNINAGTYTLARPFNIVTGDSVSEVAQDFINYIMSEDGQKIISDNGYIEVENTGSFTSSKVKGSIVVAGSSSVTPVMEKLKEAYAKVNSNASIEIQESDSTTGVNSAIEGTCDIGMASRDLKDEEKGVKATAIAKDGIAVIVNNNNTIDDLTVDQIKDIFTGAVTTWADVK